MFYFRPYLGKIPILTNIFQMGWFNHQPEKHVPKMSYRQGEHADKMYYLMSKTLSEKKNHSREIEGKDIVDSGWFGMRFDGLALLCYFW